ncbi:DUF4062 domain-containing protein [Methylobacillus methanolivorans]
MQKKHQIFISSTFIDLKDERQAAVEAILSSGHIPAGMELFAAGNDAQTVVIERWIDDSDIYMLILGSRYGSINPANGISYTEHEYDYAVSKGKPVFAVVLSENAIEKKEFTESEVEKYKSFKSKVLSRISKTVDDCKDIKIAILESIRELERRYNLHGWVRSDKQPDISPLIEQIGRISNENNELKKKLDKLPSVIEKEIDLVNIDEVITLSIEYRKDYNPRSKTTRSVKISWRELFAIFSPTLLESRTDAYMQSYIARQLIELEGGFFYSGDIVEQNFNTIKIQFMALKLIEVNRLKTVNNGYALFWQLTSSGKSLMMQLRTVKNRK